MDAYRWWFEDYVKNGGVLEIHAADLGWNGGTWIGPLPGGLKLVHHFSDNVTIIDHLHLVVTTPNAISDDELDHWGWSVHGYFSDYPANSRIVLVEWPTLQPVYLEFPYGAGFIVASSQTLEWAYGLKRSRILENSLLYMPHAHDLHLWLVAPAYVELGSSAVLSAVVQNRGFENETNVELYLLINGVVVSSATIPELLVGEFYTIDYVWTPTVRGNYNVTAYVAPVLGEERVENNVATKIILVSYYMRIHLPHEWVGGGDPMGWHADDASWQYTLPFEFPFYETYYKTIYISSNGLITFIGPDTNYDNSIRALADKLAIAPAWDDWVTYKPYDIYIWENFTHVGIRWNVRAYVAPIVANFEAILSAEGVIQFNYAYSDWPVSATIGISSGVGHVLAVDVTDLYYIDTVVFFPYQVARDVAILDVLPSTNEVKAGDVLNINVIVENQGNFVETFTVIAYATPKGNSTAFGLILPSTLPTIYVNPPEVLDLPPLSTFTISVKISDVVGLYGFDLKFRWDPLLLEYVSHSVRVPRNVYPDGVLWAPIFLIKDEVDATLGTYWMACCSLHPAPAFSGSGTFFTMTFRVRGRGSCYLTFDSTDLVDKNAFPIFHYTQSGYFSNVPLPAPLPPPLPPPMYVIGTETVLKLAPGERATLTFAWNTEDVVPWDYVVYAEASKVPYEVDLADNVFIDGVVTVTPKVFRDVIVANVTVYPSAVYAGRIVNIAVVVRNGGMVAETFNVTVYANTTMIGTQTVRDLAPGKNVTLTFRWNTTGLAPLSRFLIWAEANRVPKEDVIDNNVFVNGYVYIKRLGDINGDGRIDIYDVVLATRAYNSRPGGPHWNEDADLAPPYGIINIYDIVTITSKYGS